MLALLRVEYAKLWKRPAFLMLILLLLAGNLGFFIYAQLISQETAPGSYHKLQQVLDDLPVQQRYSYLSKYQARIDSFLALAMLDQYRIQEGDGTEAMINQLLAQYPDVENERDAYEHYQPFYTDNLYEEQTFMKQIMKEMNILQGYPAYLEGIQEKARNLQDISIFQKDDGFSHQNIEKTAKEYAKLGKVPITYESEKGVQAALSSFITNLLLLIAMMAIAMFLMFEEKEKDLFSIIKITPKGQATTILTKLIVMITSISLLTIAMITCNLIAADALYSLGSISRSLQSLASFSQCTLPLSVIQFLCLFIMTKCLAISMIAVLLLGISLLSKHRILCIATILLLLFFNLLLYLLISPTSSWNFLHYLNLIAILQTDSFFQTYLNFSILSFPISLQTTACCFMGLLFILFSVVTIVIYTKKRSLQTASLQLPWNTRHHQPSCSLYQMEAYKLLWLQKAGWILFAFLLLQIYTSQQQTLYVNQKERFYMQYMDALEGSVTKDKDAYLQQEQQRFQELHAQRALLLEQREQGFLTLQQLQAATAPIDAQLLNEDVFQDILAHYDYIKGDHQRQIFTPFAYHKLFTTANDLLLYGILAMITLVLGVSNCFAFEYGHDMHRLLACSVRGSRTLVKQKLLLLLPIITITYLIAYGPMVYQLHQTYGLPALTASMTSFVEFQQLPSWMTIWMFLLGGVLLHWIAFSCFLLITLAISVTFHHQLIAVFLSLLLFILPLFLALSGFSLFHQISLYPMLVMGKGILQYGWTPLLITGLLYSTMALFSYHWIRQHAVEH